MFVVGSGDQFIQVFDCERGLQKVTGIEADNHSIFSLVVHPTLPYVLSWGTSGSWRTCDSIKLWDWSKGWEGTHTFKSNGEGPIAFNPVNENSFASASDETIQVWNLNSAHPTYALSGHSEKVNCLDYFTCGHLQYLVSGSEDHSAKVWDLEQKICVRTLDALSPVTSVGSHPNLPILITGNKYGTVVLWSSSTFRVEKIINLSYFGEVRGLSCVMGSGRILIGQKKAISLLTVDNIDYDESSRELREQKLSVVETATAQTDMASKASTSRSELLDVQQLQFHFPLELSKNSCSLLLNNKTDERIAFRLMERSADLGCFNTFPLCAIMQPRSTYTLIVTTKIEAPEKQELDLVLQSSAYGDQHIYPLETEVQYDGFFIDVKELGRVMHEVTLTAVFGPQGERTSEVTPDGLEIISVRKIGEKKRYFDVSVTGPWILTEPYDCGDIQIWNFDTEGPVGSVSLPSVLSAKFIARKQWFLAGDKNGFVHVYDYATKLQNIKSFRAHKESVYALAVHPTKPCVLTSGLDRRIKLWNWDNSWACKKEIKLDPYGKVNPVVLNPVDTGNFASASGNNTVKVWCLDSSSSTQTQGWSQYHCFPRLFDSGSAIASTSTYTLRGHSGAVLCLDYFTSAGQQYLITGSEDQTAKIWDLETKTCVKTLDTLCAGAVTAVCPHPDLPVLITGSEDGTIRFWSSTTFSLEKVLNFGFGKTAVGLGFSDDSRRLVVWYENHIAIIELHGDNPAAITKRYERRNKSETEK